MNKYKITLKRDLIRERNQIVKLIGTAVVNIGSELFRAGSWMSDKQTDELCLIRNYEVTIIN